MLLGNLRYIRDQLSELGLTNDDICHDLLARIIFVQFLFDRKDPDGNPALTVASLHRLQKEGVLSNIHDSFHGLLSDYGDTYKLFDWLNAKFNGDLFPGKGATPEERAVGWKAEKKVVKAKHLSLLADFIRGDLDMPAGQMCLWPHYAFDVIPLEFISSIYEAFVTERAARGGIFYTPPYLVDFVLDDVLPWDGDKWDLKIIDPPADRASSWSKRSSGLFTDGGAQIPTNRFEPRLFGACWSATYLGSISTRMPFAWHASVFIWQCATR